MRHVTLMHNNEAFSCYEYLNIYDMVVTLEVAYINIHNEINDHLSKYYNEPMLNSNIMHRLLIQKKTYIDQIFVYLVEQHMKQIFKTIIFVYLNSVSGIPFIATIYFFLFVFYDQLYQQ